MWTGHLDWLLFFVPSGAVCVGVLGFYCRDGCRLHAILMGYLCVLAC